MYCFPVNGGNAIITLVKVMCYFRLYLSLAIKKGGYRPIFPESGDRTPCSDCHPFSRTLEGSLRTDTVAHPEDEESQGYLPLSFRRIRDTTALPVTGPVPHPCPPLPTPPCSDEPSPSASTLSGLPGLYRTHLPTSLPLPCSHCTPQIQVSLQLLQLFHLYF